MRTLPLLALLGCGFRGPALEQPRDDAAPAADAATDSAGDAAGCNGRVWLADFDTDPTATGDWAIRDGTPFPTAQLANGVWHIPAPGKPLDTQPLQAFTTRTLVHVRMRATAATAGHGAVFWINVGYRTTDDTFAPLFVAANLSASMQDVTVWTKVNSVETLLPFSESVPATDFADITLDIDPASLTAVVNGTTTVQLVRQPTGPVAHDGWATGVAFAAASELDLIRVEVCR